MLKNYFQNMSGHFLYFYRELRHRIFVSITLNIAVGLLDGFGLVMFLPLLEMTDTESQSSDKDLGQLDFLPKMIESIGLELSLSVVLIFMSIFFILKGGARFAGGAYNVKVLQYHQKKLRLDMVKKLNRLSFELFVKTDVGKIQNTLTGEIGRVGTAYIAYFEVIKQVILVLVYLGFALAINTSFALLVIVGALTTNILYRGIYKRTKKASKNVTGLLHRVEGYLIQLVQNYKYLKATGSQYKYENMLKDTTTQLEDENRRMGILNAFVMAIKEPILIVVVSVVILVQTSFLGQQLGPILISLLFFYRALSSLMVVQNHWNKFISRTGSLENIVEFEKFLNDNEESYGDYDGGSISEKLEFKNLSYSYGSEKVLKGINLEIKKNETVALVGESGSGKTTLVNILAGLLEVNAESLLVDGKSLRHWDLLKYRSRIGYITQEPVIFNDSIFNNITFWSDKNEENLSKFRSSIQQAVIDEFIDGLPDGEDTILGNNGMDLSGGQRQRVSIARELYKDIDILLMDEATSALDSKTEKAIQENIEKLMGSYTLIVVAHRLSTIKNADKIVLMDQGNVVASGSFSELLIKSDKFRKMVEYQDFSVVEKD